MLTSVERADATVTVPQVAIAVQSRAILSAQNGNCRMRHDLPRFIAMMEDGLRHARADHHAPLRPRRDQRGAVGVSREARSERRDRPARIATPEVIRWPSSFPLTSPQRRSSVRSRRSAPSSATSACSPTRTGMREFRDPFWPLSWDDYEASAVVQPRTVEEIQAIVRIANERRVPLWVSSQGRNNGYGGSSPRVRGSVVVNLRRMNRVLEINEELGYAVVEPGVSWFDLYEAIKAGGHRLMLSLRGPRLGQRDRQHARPRLHLPALRRRHGRGVRDGGRAAQRRAAAHRHGRDARQPRLAHLQARARPDARPALHAVELRDRHEDGRLADALPRVLHADLGARLEATTTSRRCWTRCARSRSTTRSGWSRRSATR